MEEKDKSGICRLKMSINFIARSNKNVTALDSNKKVK